MGRSRMFDNEEPGHGENPSPRTTIVGGRPPEGRGDVPPVPTGIQRLLRMAGEDARFRALLIEQRGGLAHAAGVDLSTSERAILAAVPARQLEVMIDRMPRTSPDRRDFLRQAAASAVVLLGGATLGEAVSGCKQPSTAQPPLEDEPQRPDHSDTATEGGAAPHEPPPRPDPSNTAADEPPPRPDHSNTATEGGAAPDEPPPRPDYNHMAPGGSRPDLDAGRPNPTRGIRPDVPPERPDLNDMMRTGGSAPDLPPDPDEGT